MYCKCICTRVYMIVYNIGEKSADEYKVLRKCLPWMVLFSLKGRNCCHTMAAMANENQMNHTHTNFIWSSIFFSSFSLALSVFANVMKTMLATFLDDILCRAPEKCKNITIITSYTKKNPYISTSSPFRRPALSTLLSDCHCKDVEIKQKS